MCGLWAVLGTSLGRGKRRGLDHNVKETLDKEPEGGMESIVMLSDRRLLVLAEGISG